MGVIGVCRHSNVLCKYVTQRCLYMSFLKKKKLRREMGKIIYILLLFSASLFYVFNVFVDRDLLLN